MLHQSIEMEEVASGEECQWSVTAAAEGSCSYPGAKHSKMKLSIVRNARNESKNFYSAIR